ncbi:hypothetical protein L195_g063319, partial [Trifolium pratense]
MNSINQRAPKCVRFVAAVQNSRRRNTTSGDRTRLITNYAPQTSDSIQEPSDSTVQGDGEGNVSLVDGVL